MPRRDRLVSLSLIAGTIVLGLASRRFAAVLPWWMAKNAGDVLYAVLAYWLAGLCAPRLSSIRVALIAGLFCFGIEFLKFAQTPWLVIARHNHFGTLVFGSGFHVSNLVCYVVGILLALTLETLILARLSSGR